MKINKIPLNIYFVPLIFLVLGLTFTTNINISNAQENFNISFTSTDSVGVDTTQILWSTNKQAECNVQYGNGITVSSGLTEGGVFTPLPNSVNQGRYHYVAILKDLNRNQNYYFKINCESIREVNVSTSSDTLSFVSSVGYIDRPDLTVTDISFTPIPIKGQLYNGLLNVVVKNIGNKNTESTDGILVKVSAVNGNTGGSHPLICSSCDQTSSIVVLSTENFVIGETRTVVFNLVNTPFNFSTFNVRASVDRNAIDASGVVTEIDEGNNLYTEDFKINVASTAPPVPVPYPNTSSKEDERNAQNGGVQSDADAARKLQEIKEAGEINYDTLISVDYVEEETEYEILVSKKGRFLFFVPKIIQVKVTIDSESGEITNIKKPWWSFLVNE